MFSRVFGWAGGALFAGSLAYFLYAYVIRFGVPATGGSWVASSAWNVFSFAVFALHHSVFAREPVRRWIRRSIPPDMERALYVWVASALFLLICAMWRPVPGVAWHATGATLWVLRATQAVGVWLTLRSAAILGVRTLAGIPSPDTTIASEAAADSQTESPFKTTGPYGWVRHPIYSGWFLVVFCVSPMTMTRLVFACVSSAYLLAAIPWEEGTMRRTSAGAYDDYVRKVPWRLVPGIY
jgi:protein-S-isoprenylcysteine O-methyltransferase Ste14